MAADAILSCAGDHGPPAVAIVLGSGLGPVADAIDERRSLGYDAIPGFPLPRVAGHAGRLSVGRVGTLPVAVLEGRVHYYEGAGAGAMALPLRALRAAGCETLVMTNAAGSLREAVPPGSLVLVTDHINLTGANPLIGCTSEGDGGATPFVDMTGAYDPALAECFRAAARERGIDLHQGVYACFPGPSFETPAEIRAAAVLGADTVGMSLVPETILARHCGLRVAAVSVITNYAAGIGGARLSHEQTMRAAAAATPTVRELVRAVLERLGER